MRRLAAAACVAASSACALPQHPVVAASFDASRLVRWRVVDDPDAVCRMLDSGARNVVWRIYGCAAWSSAERTCDIYTGAVDPDHNPALARALESLGHELLHCFTGQWHR